MICSQSAPGSKPSLTDSGIAEPRGNSFSGFRAEDLLRHVTPVVTAVMVDAEFFLKRSRRLFGDSDPDATADRLHRLARDHLIESRGRRIARLYRIFVYDAPPACWKGHTPLGKRALDLSKSPIAQWRHRFHLRRDPAVTPDPISYHTHIGHDDAQIGYDVRSALRRTP